MVAVSWLSFLFMIAVGLAGVPLPVGVPPLPEDPALMRTAPKDALAYVQWAGTAQADPKSANLTERLAAEPAVRALFDRLVRATRAAFRQELRGRAFAQADRALRLGLEIVQRPGCLFLSELDPQRSFVRGGVVVQLGPRAKPILDGLRSLTKAFLGSGPEKLDDAAAEALPLPPGAPPVTFRVVGQHLVVGLGPGTTERMVARLRGEGAGLGAHPAVARLAGAAHVERPSFRMFVDTAALLELLGPMPRPAAAGFAALGVRDVSALFSESGLEGDGFVSRVMLASKERRGVLALCAGRPLEATDLAVVPADASFALAARVSPAKAWTTLLQVVGGFSPRGREEMEREVVEGMERRTGVRLVEDLLAHCGDALAIWNSPRQGGLLFPGIVAALALKDAARFRAGFVKLMASAQEEMAPRRSTSGRLRRGVYLQERQIAGQTVWWLNSVGDDVPLAPAWCVTETHVMFSLFPQALTAAIRRGAETSDSLAAIPRLLSAEARAVSFVNARRVFDVAYPMLQMLAQLACAELQREGFAIDVTALPEPGAIGPHLRNEIVRLEHHEAGLRLVREGTLPFADSLLGGMLPAVASAFTYRIAVHRRRALVEARRAAAEAERRAREEARKAAGRRKKQP